MNIFKHLPKMTFSVLMSVDSCILPKEATKVLLPITQPLYRLTKVGLFCYDLLNCITHKNKNILHSSLSYTSQISPGMIWETLFTIDNLADFQKWIQKEAVKCSLYISENVFAFFFFLTKTN